MSMLTAYCISADSRRKARFHAAWTACGLPEDKIVDFSATTSPAGSRGNALSQKAAVEDALAKGLESMMLFEDDAVPCDGIQELLQSELANATENGVGALRLGWVDVPPSFRGTLDGRTAVGSHAYALLSREAMEDFLSSWNPDKITKTFLSMRVPVARTSKCLFVQYNPRDEKGMITSHGGWHASSWVMHGETTFSTAANAIGAK